MINPETYENLSINLIIAGENVVNSIGAISKKVTQKLIKNPGNLAKEKFWIEKEVKKIIKKFGLESIDWIEKDLTQAYIKGLKNADYTISKLKGPISNEEIVNGSFLANRTQVPPIAPIPEIPGQVLLQFEGYANHPEFFGVFRSAAYYNLSQLQIMRSADDIYRKIAVMVGEKEFQEGTILTRQKLSQELLNEYAKRGLTSITYKNGRRISIDDYCEMLGRTMSGRCSVQASLNRYQERGYNLGIVSAHFRACDLCTPYEGTILSLDGKSDKYPSIWDAETAGLFHPNCKHDISAYFEGITPEIPVRMDRAEQNIIDEFGYKNAQKIAYKAQMKQRYIERNIRKWKRYDSVSLDELSKKRAQQKIKYYQREQRNHLKENTFLKRDYSREQIKRAH